MPMHLYHPGDWIPDPGGDERVYEIQPKHLDNTEIVYDKQIQKMSYIQGNLVAIFSEWFQSFFPDNYFKFVRIKTQAPFSVFKSFMKDIYKKEKPFLVIDPRPPEYAEDSIFAQNMLNRYNLMDPDHDNIGAKLLYSLQIMGSDLFELWYRRNRLRCEFDIMIMEQNTNRQMNTYNAMVMNIRHNSRFTLTRKVPFLIPIQHIRNIANFHKMDWKSEDFLKFMNSISRYPILRRVLPSGHYLFFMEQELHVHVETPGMPGRDSAENSEAIEWGARVVDSFIFTADLPAEFLFLTRKEYVGRFDHHIDEDPENISFISPVYADLDWPTEIGEYKLTNRLDIMVQEGDEKTLQVLPLIADYDKDIYAAVQDWVDHKGKLADLVRIRVYPNGSYDETGTILHEDGVLELLAPQMNKLYTANIYVNLRTVNLYREGKNKKFIGDIEKY